TGGRPGPGAGPAPHPAADGQVRLRDRHRDQLLPAALCCFSWAVPLCARSAGASTGLAGLTTTALTLSSVAAYPVTPRLMARYGTRAVLAGGLLALGLPALALAVTANIGLILAACVVRGAGFAVLCVAGGALTVSLIPAHRRGEGLALVGLVSGVPSVAARSCRACSPP